MESGQPCPRVSCVNSGSRGHCCPRSRLWRSLESTCFVGLPMLNGLTGGHQSCLMHEGYFVRDRVTRVAKESKLDPTGENETMIKSKVLLLAACAVCLSALPVHAAAGEESKESSL